MTNLSLIDLGYMQDMSSAICSNSNINDTKQLIDKRDSKTYWVTKLKDSNCWMTQNLDLDLSTSKALTSADSDVTANWTPANSTGTVVATVSGWGEDNTAVKSYDPGEYVYTTPMERNNCGGSNITSLSQCTGKGWQLVTGLSKDYSGSAQAHYLAGNYYSYAAATAGTGSSATTNGANASGSICPKGWQLPTSNNTNSKSFGGLFAAYGTLSGLNAGVQDIRLAPLYFVHGGYVTSSSPFSAGSSGYNWSSTANSASNAYNLYFATAVYPSSNYANGYDRYFGFSVRCVAK